MYKILKHTSAELLETEVNAYLQRGWKLEGGLCTVLPYTESRGWKNSVTYGNAFFMQAVTKVASNTN